MERRTLQKAADAAALAASQDPANVPMLARRYSAANGGPSVLLPCPPSGQPLGDAGGCYTSPYDGNPDKVEIVITESVPTLFAKIVGVSRFKIKVRAVALKNVRTATTPGRDDEPGRDDPGLCLDEHHEHARSTPLRALPAGLRRDLYERKPVRGTRERRRRDHEWRHLDERSSEGVGTAHHRARQRL